MTATLCRILVRLLEQHERKTRDHRDTAVLVLGRRLLAAIETQMENK